MIGKGTAPLWWGARRRIQFPQHPRVTASCPHPSQPLESAVPVMSGKRAFLDLLKQEGVEMVFGNPGTTELPLMDAFAVENEIRYVLGLQEAALMAMADGYAQEIGRASCRERVQVWGR